MGSWKLVLALFCMGWLIAQAGCASRPGVPTPPARSGGEPLAMQMLRTDAQMRKFPFRTLLDFEAPTDAIFVKLNGGSPALESGQSHTGSTSLAIPASTRAFSVNLPSLTSGTAFPGRWTLLGAYFRSNVPQRLSASYMVDSIAHGTIRVELPAGQWVPVLLDLASLDAAAAGRVGILQFAFEAGLAGPLYCDNIVVVDNTQTLVDESGFTVREMGFQYFIARPPGFSITLKTPELSDRGWVLNEANRIRAVFTSRQAGKSWVIYADGRAFEDGKFKTLGVERALAAGMLSGHEHPAGITVTPEMGRVIRNNPADANNDGYLESEGIYLVAASGPRLELVLSPNTPLLVRPVLLITGLPEGKPLATMEGRLVEKVVRRPDGAVLLELPGVLDRSVTLNVRVTP